MIARAHQVYATLPSVQFRLSAIFVLGALMLSCAATTTGEGPSPSAPGASGQLQTRPAPTTPGKSVADHNPTSKDLVAVVGVAEDESLPVYALPRRDSPVVGEFASSATEISGLGEAFRGEDGVVWWLVNRNTVQGWVVPRLAYLGNSEDVTPQILAKLGHPTASSHEELSESVALAEQESLPGSRLVLVSAGKYDDSFRGLTIYDLMLDSDSVLAGYRLMIAGDASHSAGGEYVLTSVERLALCRRGVTDGACT